MDVDFEEENLRSLQIEEDEGPIRPSSRIRRRIRIESEVSRPNTAQLADTPRIRIDGVSVAYRYRIRIRYVIRQQGGVSVLYRLQGGPTFLTSLFPPFPPLMEPMKVINIMDTIQRTQRLIWQQPFPTQNRICHDQGSSISHSNRRHRHQHRYRGAEHEDPLVRGAGGGEEQDCDERRNE
ncbi:hypothetical protein SASPL_106862 [Salvia splendens]|uniref:Uncharacterized protein n=1 Tax=Salvia splendens TaxID=180675 RepID=A0A8X8YF18_SALSN|nr:hypothetical protein SASPL_106862 [Salvia splendens]